MGLTSLFKRPRDAAPSALPVGDAPDTVQQARTRARRRLIGATLLVAIGIIGFPLVFETQPRPVAVDIPIEVPRKDAVAPLVMPAARPPAVVSAPTMSSGTEAAREVPKPPRDADVGDVITESREDAGPSSAATNRSPAEAGSAGRGATSPAVAGGSSAPPPAVAKTAAKNAADAAATTAVNPVATARKEASADDGARARALLEGKVATANPGAQPSLAPAAIAASSARPEAARYVVQVGAFADAAAARETRLKVEHLGLKTYTQITSTSAGNRIRVRVGPFGTHDEAEKALAKARGAGLSAVVLAL